MAQTIKIKHTTTPNQAPANNSLAVGELAVEVGAQATPRLWVGVPPATDATGKVLLADGAGNAILISPTVPPITLQAGTLWWNSNTGLLYVLYDDGNSVQWVIASWTEDAGKVAKAGDTMIGALNVVDPPTAPTHAASKAYVDAIAAGGSGQFVRFDAAQSLTDGQKSQARVNISAVSRENLKNYIINGAMQIAQPVNGWNQSTQNGPAADRFMVPYAGSAFIPEYRVLPGVFSQYGSQTRLSFGLKSPGPGTPAAAEYAFIVQPIEAYSTTDLRLGTAAARTVTLSFGVRAPAGTYCVAFYNSVANRRYIAEYNIAAGEANTDVYRSITVPLDQGGAWLIEPAKIGLNVAWILRTGSNFYGTANTWQATTTVLSTANQFSWGTVMGQLFQLFDVQLCVGTANLNFVVPPYDEDLRRCQRYYVRFTPSIFAENFSMGVDANTVAMQVSWPVPLLRSDPQVSIAGMGWNYAGVKVPSLLAANDYGCTIQAVSNSAYGTRMYVVSQGGTLTADAAI